MNKVTLINTRGVEAAMRDIIDENDALEPFRPGRAITGRVHELPDPHSFGLYKKDIIRKNGVVCLINWAIGWDYL